MHLYSTKIVMVNIFIGFETMSRSSWQLLLFDLDGLLVNTEMMHYRAYQRACHEVGGIMNWDFDTYFQVASMSLLGLRERLYRENSHVFEKISWNDFYERKQHALLELLKTEPIPLMPGVVELLERAKASHHRMACVTHSRKSFVDTIRQQHSVLSSIHSWYTRESYERAKPFPDGYIKAVETEGALLENVIGFEDSLRGIQAQVESGIHPVLVTKDLKTKEAAQAYPSVIILNSLYEAIALLDR